MKKTNGDKVLPVVKNTVMCLCATRACVYIAASGRSCKKVGQRGSPDPCDTDSRLLVMPNSTLCVGVSMNTRFPVSPTPHSYPTHCYIMFVSDVNPNLPPESVLTVAPPDLVPPVPATPVGVTALPVVSSTPLPPDPTLSGDMKVWLVTLSVGLPELARTERPDVPESVAIKVE